MNKITINEQFDRFRMGNILQIQQKANQNAKLVGQPLPFHSPVNHSQSTKKQATKQEYDEQMQA